MKNYIQNSLILPFIIIVMFFTIMQLFFPDVAYAEGPDDYFTLTEKLNIGTIPRTSLPPGSIRNMEPAIYNVTKGAIEITRLPRGTMSRIVSIFVEDPSNQLQTGFFHPEYNVTNQPLASNIGSVLHELKSNGVARISSTMVRDERIMNFIYDHAANESISRSSKGIYITKTLINTLGKVA